MKNKVKILESIEEEIRGVNSDIEYNMELQLKYPGKEGLKINQRTLMYVHSQLLERREAIIKELEFETVELVFETQYKRVAARVLGRFLDGFQEVIIGIVRSLRDGKEATGRASNKIIREATYEVTTFNPGSFKVSLLSKASHAEQRTFGQTTAKDAIDQLDTLIRCKDDIKLIKQRQEKLGIPVIQKYKNFMKIVYSNKANFTINDLERNENIRSEVVTAELAKKIFDVIDNSKEEPEDEVDYYGELVAVDIDKYEFGFIFQDGDVEERINGEFDKSIKKLVKSNLEKFCTAKFKRFKVYNELSEDFKYTWELIGFEKE